MAKTGIYEWFGYRIANEERYMLIKEAGFDSVLLWWEDDHEGCGGDKNKLPDTARKAGLEIENIHAPFDKSNSIWTDGIEAEDVVKLYADCISDCHIHGIPSVVIHLTSGETPPPPTVAGLNRLKYLVSLAEQKDVNIALENLRRPEYLQLVFDSIKSDRLGFCYDSGHENCFTKGADFLSMYGDKLIAIHLHDNDGTADLHLLPGEGTVNWEAVAGKLKKINYCGAVTLEVTNEFSKLYTDISAFEYLKIAKEKLDKLFL